jgi:Glucodextranase, domain N
VAKGITSEVFYPRIDIPNMQDMQYIVTDGSTFVDLERDATNHVVSMPDEKALEYTITNTDKRATPKYGITNTYITDVSRDTLLIRTRFQSLDGGTYQLYLLENPSMAGGGANDSAWWDGTNAALMSSGTETLFGSSTTVVSALKVASPNDFVAFLCTRDAVPAQNVLPQPSCSVHDTDTNAAPGQTRKIARTPAIRPHLPGRQRTRSRQLRWRTSAPARPPGSKRALPCAQAAVVRASRHQRCMFRLRPVAAIHLARQPPQTRHQHTPLFAIRF